MLHKRKTYHLVILDVGVSPNTYLFTTSGRTNEITARMSPSCIISCICVHDLWEVRKCKFDENKTITYKDITIVLCSRSIIIRLNGKHSMVGIIKVNEKILSD